MSSWLMSSWALYSSNGGAGVSPIIGTEGLLRSPRPYFFGIYAFTPTIAFLPSTTQAVSLLP